MGPANLGTGTSKGFMVGTGLRWPETGRGDRSARRSRFLENPNTQSCTPGVKGQDCGGRAPASFPHGLSSSSRGSRSQPLRRSPWDHGGRDLSGRPTPRSPLLPGSGSSDSGELTAFTALPSLSLQTWFQKIHSSPNMLLFFTSEVCPEDRVCLHVHTRVNHRCSQGQRAAHQHLRQASRGLPRAYGHRRRPWAPPPGPAIPASRKVEVSHKNRETRRE